MTQDIVLTLYLVKKVGLLLVQKRKFRLLLLQMIVKKYIYKSMQRQRIN